MSSTVDPLYIVRKARSDNVDYHCSVSGVQAPGLLQFFLGGSTIHNRAAWFTTFCLRRFATSSCHSPTRSSLIIIDPLSPFTSHLCIVFMASNAISRHAPNIRFRVLIIGRANAGKTSILQRVCVTTESPKVYRITGDSREEVGNNSCWLS